ncbi:MAG TPA: trypsin-like peptidase domain-containing protein [Verrucomicrobiae bacterium]|nr:trypsin-like peptidase domain-containing protein [Verrucomicrobiae bacterium]
MTCAAGLVILYLACIIATGLKAAEGDIRRDATVEAVQRVMPSVVNVATEEVVPIRDPLENLFRDFFNPYYRNRPPNTQFSLGSGVIIDEEGFVLTNFHVVGRASRVWIKLSDGREYEADKLVGTSFTDVALVKIRAKKGEKFTAVKFAADDDLLLGETVLALGNPFGLGGSVTRGILSSKSRRPPTEGEPLDVMDWLQTDAAINPGNSGGPLINLKGALIGINVAVYREGQGIGFAIPVKRVSAALAEIYSPEMLESLWFGARVRPGPAPMQVLSVQEQSPAGKAGLEAGDSILEVNGKSPSGFIDFNRELIAAKDKNPVTLLVQHEDNRRTIKVRLVPESTFFNAELIRRKTGATVQELTPQLAREFAFGNFTGVLVAEVDRGTSAATAGLEEGMLVTSIDGQVTPNVVPAAKMLYARKKGDKTKLEVVFPRRRGPFIEYRRGTVELQVQ